MKIFVPYDEVWDYFQENKTRLLYACDEIARSEGENDKVSVFLTEENGRPRLTVETDGAVLEYEMLFCNAITNYDKTNCLYIQKTVCFYVYK